MKRASFLALLVATTALVSASLAHAQAQATPQSSSLPHNSQLVSGAATVSQTSATQTTITQTSQSAILNWQSFSIGKGDTVDVIQPGTTSVLLNRVTGQAPSTIAGQLNANGQVFLINPNGIVIGKTGVVQASGFVASTLDVSDSDFLAGRLNFKARGPSAAVVHAGTIRIAPGGYAALLGGSVTDTGEIVAPLGKVAIGAGSAATLDLSGDGFLQVALTGTTDATGVALLSAADARDAVRQTVNMDGVTAAASATGQDGHVVLSGTVDTSDASGAGGNVKVLGTKLDLGGGVITAGHAQVETSGDTVDFTGIKVSAGNWLVDPTNLTIDAAAAATISSNLATTDVTLQTTASGASGPGVQSSGVGDIIVSSAITWGSSHQLTLDAYHGISIDSPITVSGAGKVSLLTANGGDYDFGLGPAGFAGNINFAGSSATSFPGQALNINGASYTLLHSFNDLAQLNASSGDFALATTLDTLFFTTSYHGTASFNGQFTGLGNSIMRLNNVLFGSIGSGAVIRDLGLSKGSMGTGAISNQGVLAGDNEGTVNDTYSSSNIIGRGNIGGLVGYNGGTIENSFATGTAGGSTNDVSTNSGGLVGENAGTILNSYAIGIVSGYYAVGGLVGFNDAGTGGAAATIVDSFATGSIVDYGHAAYMGGLVGINSGVINSSYATGAVATGAGGGGLVGLENGGTIHGGYYDALTSGKPTGVQADGSTGLSTGQLQASLPAAYDSSVWGWDQGLYPYLKSLNPGGVQAVTGYAYYQGNVLPQSRTAVQLYSGGLLLNAAPTYSGANGYYYIALPAHSLTAATPFGTTIRGYGTSLLSGVGFTDAPLISGNVVSNRNMTNDRAYGWVSAPTWSATLAEMNAAFGTSVFTSLQAMGPLSNYIDFYATAPSFRIDQAVTDGYVFKITEVNHTGNLIVDAAINAVRPGVTVMLISFGGLTINAPIAVGPQSLADLRYDYYKVMNGGTADPLALSLDAGGGVNFVVSNGAAATNSQDARLKLNDTEYTLVYSMAQLDAIDGINGVTGWGTTRYGPGEFGNYALAGDLNAAGSVYSQSLIDSFAGTFNGLGHSIANLRINFTATSDFDDSVGLFGQTSGTIADVALNNLSLTANDTIGYPLYIGGLVASASGAIYNVGVSGEVNANGSHVGAVGGMVGYGNLLTMVNANASDSVDGVGQVGGLIGSAGAVTVSRSSATGHVEGSGSGIGGLVGALGNGGSVSQSFATGTIDGGPGASVGGLVGEMLLATIDRSYATGNVSASGAAVIGGLVGMINTLPTGSGAISNSYATGNVTDTGTTINARIGGLVGSDLYTPISSSYATGLVQPSPSGSTEAFGGLLGFNSSGVITDGYWNMTTSGQSRGGGFGIDTTTSLTTAQLQSGTLPTGFDPAIWTAVAGHNPKLVNVAGQ